MKSSVVTNGLCKQCDVALFSKCVDSGCRHPQKPMSLWGQFLNIILTRKAL